MDSILVRDQENSGKLQVGINYAMDKGILDAKFVPEHYVNVDVLGKTLEHVCADIFGFMTAESK